MRLVDADELIEHAWRDRLDSRELIVEMIEKAPTVKEIRTNIPLDIFERLLKQSQAAPIEELKRYQMNGAMSFADSHYERYVNERSNTRQEEHKGVNDYIESISRPTGVNAFSGQKMVSIEMLQEIRQEMLAIKEAEKQIYGNASWNFTDKCIEIIDTKIKELSE